VRIECQQHRCEAELRRFRSRASQHGAMAEMDAVEIADRYQRRARQSAEA
jgi:hypothetical protein